MGITWLARRVMHQSRATWVSSRSRTLLAQPDPVSAAARTAASKARIACDMTNPQFKAAARPRVRTRPAYRAAEKPAADAASEPVHGPEKRPEVRKVSPTFFG